MIIQGLINNQNSSRSKVIICPTIKQYKYAIERKMVLTKNFSGRLRKGMVFIEIPKQGQLTTSDLVTVVI